MLFGMNTIKGVFHAVLVQSLAPLVPALQQKILFIAKTQNWEKEKEFLRLAKLKVLIKWQDKKKSEARRLRECAIRFCTNCTTIKSGLKIIICV